MGRALETDLYELTMAAAHFAAGTHRCRVACELFVRKLPPHRTYLLAAGLEAAIDWLTGLRFDAEELGYLARTRPLAGALARYPDFREFLASLRFTGDVDAIPEGTVVFPEEPLLRVEAEVVEAQLAETFLLSALNHATAVATKAARVVTAAAGAEIAEFGTRRTHPVAGIDAARAAYLAGCAGTSNVEAGRRFGIPVLGTAAHLWTMFHESEREAFARYFGAFPDASLLLVDTYDTLSGTRHAIEATGGRLVGVRLDSGDLLALSREVRQLFDAAGLPGVRIVASGDLEEHAIARLVGAGAPIDVYGVGTELVVSGDAPSVGGVYKLVAVERDGRWVETAKLSAGKVSLPGRKQVFRRTRGGRFEGDALGLVDEAPPPGTAPLLVPVLRGGRRVAPPVPLATSRARARDSLAALPEHVRAIAPPPGAAPYPVAPTERLAALRDRVHGELLARLDAERGPRERTD
jgi:nicotinate phosphoribosyltransferase